MGPPDGPCCGRFQRAGRAGNAGVTGRSRGAGRSRNRTARRSRSRSRSRSRGARRSRSLACSGHNTAGALAHYTRYSAHGVGDPACRSCPTARRPNPDEAGLGGTCLPLGSSGRGRPVAVGARAGPVTGSTPPDPAPALAGSWPGRRRTRLTIWSRPGPTVRAGDSRRHPRPRISRICRTPLTRRNQRTRRAKRRGGGARRRPAERRRGHGGGPAPPGHQAAVARRGHQLVGGHPARRTDPAGPSSPRCQRRPVLPAYSTPGCGSATAPPGPAVFGVCFVATAALAAWAAGHWQGVGGGTGVRAAGGVQPFPPVLRTGGPALQPGGVTGDRLDRCPLLAWDATHRLAGAPRVSWWPAVALIYTDLFAVLLRRGAWRGP